MMIIKLLKLAGLGYISSHIAQIFLFIPEKIQNEFSQDRSKYKTFKEQLANKDEDMPNHKRKALENYV